jgi:hypothetical protein
MSGRQISEKEFKKDYTPTERPMIEGLRRLGHDVTVSWHPTGDASLKERYDLAFVGLVGYNQISAMGRRYGALWAMTQLPHVAYVGDWQVETLCRALRRPEESLWAAMERDEDGIKAITCRPIHVMAERMIKPPKILLPLHPWGDKEVFRKHCPKVGEIFEWDPSPIQIETLDFDERVGTLTGRVMKWFCTSLSPVDKYLKTLGARWPIEGYWDKKRHTYLSEKDILETHLREYGGVISPSRVGGGNDVPGWWRARNMHYAARLIPCCADGREMGVIRQHFPSAAVIEGVGPEGRQEIADAQKKAMLDATATVAESLQALSTIVQNAVVEPVQ